MFKKILKQKFIILLIIILLLFTITTLHAKEKCEQALDSCTMYAVGLAGIVFCLVGYAWCVLFIGK